MNKWEISAEILGDYLFATAFPLYFILINYFPLFYFYSAHVPHANASKWNAVMVFFFRSAKVKRYAENACADEKSSFRRIPFHLEEFIYFTSGSSNNKKASKYFFLFFRNNFNSSSAFHLKFCVKI